MTCVSISLDFDPAVFEKLGVWVTKLSTSVTVDVNCPANRLSEPANNPISLNTSVLGSNVEDEVDELVPTKVELSS